MNVCRLVEYEGDFRSKFRLFLPSQSKGGGGSSKKLANLVNNRICDVGIVRVKAHRK